MSQKAIVRMNLSTAGTRSFLLFISKSKSISEKNFFHMFKLPVTIYVSDTKTLLWYICSTCLIDEAIVRFFVFMSSAVPKFIQHDTVTTRGISLMYIISMFPCHSKIPVGRSNVTVGVKMYCESVFFYDQ